MSEDESPVYETVCGHEEFLWGVYATGEGPFCGPECFSEFMDTCPICHERSVTRCRCMMCDRSCKNRHHWFRCNVHERRLLGQADHKGYASDCHCWPAPDRKKMAEEDAKKEKKKQKKRKMTCLCHDCEKDPKKRSPSNYPCFKKT
jgi:hypothetical protein